ncbi:NAD(P)-dependent oxidoreductase [Cystobacter ferrugineus]|uniref:6-phosphogluconate dehydrogenase n=1 Tax=Cystobacter ferrugineus TaxID=83449 RepID=A0A1L9AVJ5_9BACT|nr:NAD(P)-binding domain-containing protein [Cystobacter ferrugineus]OJH34016.1 6-phosphogluconate dehydrogenase [Cystobacter ferrugineus]
MKPGISVLGTGRMGSALVGAFLKQGYNVAVWNRTKSKCAPLAALGARVATTVRDAVADAEVVVVNVNDYVTSEALLRQDDVTKGLRGKLIVQLTSGSPRQAREMAAWARQHELQYLDGAIMGTPNFIGEPGGTILYSGPGALFEKYKPVLLVLGGNSLHVGSDVGHASALDSALLSFLWGSMFGVLQAVSVCEAEGLPLGAYMEYVQATKPMVDGAVTDFVKRIQTGRFAGDEKTLATVEAHHGALRHLIELCEEHGIHHAVPAAFGQLFQAALQAGHAQDDFAVLNKFMK